MKSWVIVLYLFSANGQQAGDIMVPGLYNQSECFAVKAMMDRDHEARLHGPGAGQSTVYFTKSLCIDGAQFTMGRQ